MTNTKKNAPEALQRDEGVRSTNYQKEETMKQSLPNNRTDFDTRFTLPTVNIGNISLRAGHMTGGNEPDQPIVVLDVPARDAALSAQQAISLGAAISALGVHLLEQEQRTITRRTSPGQPAFEESI